MIPSLIGIIASSGGGAFTDYQSIATATVSSSATSIITFSSIPSTYQHLQIRYIARETSNGAIWLTYNGDASPSNYTTHRLWGDGAGVTSQGWGTGSFRQFVSGVPGGTDLSNSFGVGVIDILDYANTNKYTTSRSLSGYDVNGSTPIPGQVYLNSGLWLNTAAVNSISLESQNFDFAQYSSFALYGIKG